MPNPEPPAVGPLGEEVAKWADSLLQEYLARINGVAAPPEKQVHDPVARTIILSGPEAVILDSPLLQRLRYIRQLGVGHYLFPSAGYSRFEHSLGALRAATTVFDTVFASRGPSRYSFKRHELEAYRQIVRLAALVHDVGHCVFSHVSERFYEQHPDVRSAVGLLGKHYSHTVSASEAISISIVLSPAFQELVKLAGACPSAMQPSDFVGQVASCIAGSVRRLEPACFMSEMVNGAIDCDKMDYLVRDAYIVGVPISLDVDRLYSKLRIAEKKTKHGKTVWVLAVEQSGTRALEELLATRIFMYDKFYYHHKVMAAEELVRRALQKLSEVVPAFRHPVTLLGYCDDELLCLTPATLAARYDLDPKEPGVNRACQLLARVKWRSLPKRAFAFARRFIPEPPDLFALFESGGRPDQLNWRNTQYEVVNDLLEQENSRDGYIAALSTLCAELGGTGEVFIGVQPPRRASGGLDVPVIDREGKAENKPPFLFEGSKWSDAYALNKQTSYVFADAAIEKVHLASERLFAERELMFPPSSWMLAKLTREQVDAARASLPATEEWRPHRLAPDYLTTEPAQERITALKGKFASLLNTSVGRQDGPALVENWLWQILDPSLQETAIAFLEYLTFVEKQDVIDGYAAILEERPELRSCVWVAMRPTRGQGGSADQLTYDLKSLSITVRAIEGLTDEELGARGIVLFDDALNTGTQLCTLVSSWFGRTDLYQHAPDADQKPLSSELQRILASRDLYLAFHASHPVGRGNVSGLFEALGLRLRDIAYHADLGDPRLTLDGFTAPLPDEGARFIDYLRDRGTKLLKILKSDWNEEKRGKFALGYDNLRLAIAYHHGVSTGLPVALWAFVPDPLHVWLPVLPREPAKIVDAIKKLRQPAATLTTG